MSETSEEARNETRQAALRVAIKYLRRYPELPQRLRSPDSTWRDLISRLRRNRCINAYLDRAKAPHDPHELEPEPFDALIYDAAEYLSDGQPELIRALYRRHRAAGTYNPLTDAERMTLLAQFAQHLRADQYGGRSVLIAWTYHVALVKVLFGRELSERAIKKARKRIAELAHTTTVPGSGWGPGGVRSTRWTLDLDDAPQPATFGASALFSKVNPSTPAHTDERKYPSPGDRALSTPALGTPDDPQALSTPALSPGGVGLGYSPGLGYLDTPAVMNSIEGAAPPTAPSRRHRWTELPDEVPELTAEHLAATDEYRNSRRKQKARWTREWQTGAVPVAGARGTAEPVAPEPVATDEGVTFPDLDPVPVTPKPAPSLTPAGQVGDFPDLRAPEPTDPELVETNDARSDTEEVTDGRNLAMPTRTPCDEAIRPADRQPGVAASGYPG